MPCLMTLRMSLDGTSKHPSPSKLSPSLHAGLNSGAELLELQYLLNVGNCFASCICPVLLPDMPAQRLSASVLHNFDTSWLGYLASPQTDANRCCLLRLFPFFSVFTGY